MKVNIVNKPEDIHICPFALYVTSCGPLWTLAGGNIPYIEASIYVTESIYNATIVILTDTEISTLNKYNIHISNKDECTLPLFEITPTNINKSKVHIKKYSSARR